VAVRSSISSGGRDLRAVIKAAGEMMQGGVTMMEFVRNDLVAILFGCMFAGKVTLLFWLVSQQPWVAVLISNALLGLCLVREWRLSDETDRLWEDKRELEKQVVSLRTTVDHMARARLEDEVDRRRAQFYLASRRSLDSSKSL
jgi:xanthine/CO dehydrogenase XdhC/CoxF family maturation factor